VTCTRKEGKRTEKQHSRIKKKLGRERRKHCEEGKKPRSKRKIGKKQK